MESSILTSTKQILGLDENYTVFDLDVITHINSAFAVLNDIGLGPVGGFFIEDKNPTWEEIGLTPHQTRMARTYIFLKVRMLFDPPTTSFHIEAMNEQIREYEWRLSVSRESTDYTAPGEVA